MDRNIIAAAVRAHGAKAVYDAAYRRMAGDRAALPAVGIADVRTLADADRIGRIAFAMLSPADRSADAADATIKAASIGARK